ncbi:type II toxin-antitoxin system prevent-host-death family antitoxin [soil metagenome]
MRSVGAYEAKTHLPRLLEDVARGETITITKHGVPVATLGPLRARPTMTHQEAVAGLRDFRRGRRLGDSTIRQLIDEGRS